MAPSAPERDPDPTAAAEAEGRDPTPTHSEGAREPPARAVDELRRVVRTGGDAPTVVRSDEARQRNRRDPHRRAPRQIPPAEDDDAAGSDTAGQETAGEGATDDAADPQRTHRERTSDGRRGRTDDPESAAARQKRAAIRRIEGSDAFRAIRACCVFDDLQVVEPRDGGRYVDAIRVRADHDGDVRGVSVGLVDRPQDDTTADATERLPVGFPDAVADALARWQRVCHADGVVTVHDWNHEPRPWLARDPVGETLAEWDCPDTAVALRNALSIAESVAGLHRQGVIHAGLDPGNVVFPGDALVEHPTPLVDNVAMMHALREYFEPSAYLDPRYAAPEYFDDGFGGIDQATDVYQLGAVVYHCLTGRAPFRGTYGEVREGVLSAEPDQVSAHNASLPDPVDDIIAKALAKRKLMRYESASQFRADLRGVCERSGFSVDG
ncbi:MAG: hypothetical protein ABEJ31_13535 [Haloarculaceae archaeon]